MKLNRVWTYTEILVLLYTHYMTLLIDFFDDEGYSIQKKIVMYIVFNNLR